MGFPENVLAKSEKVERSIHPHWITVVGPLLLGLVLIAGGIALSAATPNDATGNGIQWVSVGVLLLIAIPLVLVPFLRWRTTHYVMTSHRVMVRRGILTKSGKDITLSKITDVSFEQSVLDRIISSGSLRIESAGDSPDETAAQHPAQQPRPAAHQPPHRRGRHTASHGGQRAGRARTAGLRAG